MYNNPDGVYLIIPIAIYVAFEVFVRNPIITRREKVRKLLEEEMKKKQNRNRERYEPVSQRRGAQRVSVPRPAVVQVPVDLSSVPKVNVATDWFIDKWVADMKISAAEQLIINELEKYPVVWYREVSWKGFVTPRNSHYRYDFWLPGINTICEYHGKMAHMDDEKIANDKIKEEFCKVNGIRLVVYRGKDYYHMEDRIKELLGK